MSGSEVLGAAEFGGIFPVGREDPLTPALAELRQGGRLLCRGAAALLREAVAEVGSAVVSAHSLTLWDVKTEGRKPL